MIKNWVLNASPIILLGKADLLKTISPLAKTWIIPNRFLYSRLESWSRRKRSFDTGIKKIWDRCCFR